MALSAEAFAAGHDFFGPITISGHVVISGAPPHYVLLGSDPVHVNVRPLPTGQPVNFNGSIGTFSLGTPQLSTNRIRVGQPVRLTVAVHSDGALNRLVAPTPPVVNDWEIIPDNPPDFSFTLIPLTDMARQTPAIPFSSFDPAPEYLRGFDHSVSPRHGHGRRSANRNIPGGYRSYFSAPLKLGGLSPSPGSSAARLVPLQLRGGFVCLQIVPVLAILGLWRWDVRRDSWKRIRPSSGGERRAASCGAKNAGLARPSGAVTRRLLSNMRPMQ